MMTQSKIARGEDYVLRFKRVNSCAKCVRIALMIVLFFFVSVQVLMMVLTFFGKVSAA